MDPLQVGMIGYKFMGKAHSHAYRDLPMFFPGVPAPVMKAVCGRDEAGVNEAARRFGWEEALTDWRELVARADIGLIDINAPSNVHKEIAVAAARAGKHVLCEKPLALTLSGAREMLAAAEAAGVKHMVGFNYRFAPAVQLAKKLIAEGRLGKLYHFRAAFLQDWLVDPAYPFVWRLDKRVAGSGAFGDLGAHLIDLARFLVGEMTEVTGMSETFIKERPLAAASGGSGALGGSGTLGGSGALGGAVTSADVPGAPGNLNTPVRAGAGAGNKPEAEASAKAEVEAGGPKGTVTVDDATLFLARFANGALGSFEASRFAAGRRNANTFEINGSAGSIRFDFERMNELEVYFTDDAPDVQGFRRVLATDPAHAYMEAWWPPGHTIGFEHTFIHELVELLAAIRDDRRPSPNFTDGVRCQEVLEAVERSIAEKRWVSLREVQDLQDARDTQDEQDTPDGQDTQDKQIASDG